MRYLITGCIISSGITSRRQTPPVFRGVQLDEKLSDTEAQVEAVEALRALIEGVTLVPDGNELAIMLCGDLAAILTFAANKKEAGPLLGASLLSPVSVVAGAGFEPATFRL